MSDSPSYSPPAVWTWKPGNGGVFANINRPTAGARFEAELLVGKHPLQLYSLATPNGVKVTIMLEELLALGHAGAEYDAYTIDIGKGEQFSSGFVALNPNSKIPALLDRSGPEPVRVFESGAILLYLAEKFGALLPQNHAARTEALSWLFWQTGAGAFVGGGFGHFYKYADIRIEYAIDRYAMGSSGSSTCSTSGWPGMRTWPATTTASPTSLAGRGTAAWSATRFTAQPSSWTRSPIRTCCAGRPASLGAKPCSADGASIVCRVTRTSSSASGTRPAISTARTQASLR